MGEPASTLSLMEEVKLQAQVLVPVLHALRAEVGAARADRIVGDALRDWAQRLYREIGAAHGSDPRERFDAVWQDLRPRIGDAVTRQNLRQSEAAWDYNVTACRYADFFRALGEPELGTLLLCDIDMHVADLAEGTVELTRTQTIMKGAPYCDFRYRMKARDG